MLITLWFFLTIGDGVKERPQNYHPRFWQFFRYRDSHGSSILNCGERLTFDAMPKAVAKVCKRWRKVIETVGSHLTELFSIARTRAKDLWHYQSRIIRKVLAHTVGVFLNLQMWRPSLDLDGLLAI